MGGRRDQITYLDGAVQLFCNLALESIGRTPKALYDGSWSDWGTREDAPVETGPAKK